MNRTRQIRTKRMVTSFVLAAAICSWAAQAEPAPPHPAPQNKQKPNVLLIVADDMSVDLACYGHQRVKTPNLDRLARQGVRFARAYCQHPVCNPSRTTMLSGRRSIRRKSPPQFMPNWFRDHGYFVAEFGKVAHSYGVSRQRTKWDHQERASIPRIVEFLESPDKVSGVHTNGKPLLVCVGLTHTHVGFNHTREMLALYPPEQIELAEVPSAFRASHPDAAFSGININTERTAAERQLHTARYYAAISTIDELVGELLAALERLKQRDHTIVVFTSDHGLHLGDRGGIYDKRTLWERATQVPLIVSAAGQQYTGHTSGLVELVDVFPSLCELCGIALPAGMEGTSFVPLMANPKRDWKRAAFSSTYVRGTRGRSLRTDRYRYIDWNGGKAFQLYDHQSDPHEFVNLADRTEHAETLAALGKLLEAGWQAALPPKND